MIKVVKIKGTLHLAWDVSAVWVSSMKRRQVWILIFWSSISYMLSIADITDWCLFKLCLRLNHLGKPAIDFGCLCHSATGEYSFSISLTLFPSVCLCLSWIHTRARTHTHAQTHMLVLLCYGILPLFFCVTTSCQSYSYASLLHLYITTCRLWCSRWGKALLTALRHWDSIQEGLKEWASSWLWKPSFHLVKWGHQNSLQRSAMGINKDKETKALLRCWW